LRASCGTLARMTRYRKRKALDLFVEALVHPVRFR
jgi:hypothetical protein